ncbi:hypothetical protein [Arthrobacter mangrovi]|nr:hypothetical protein [Arthrobacter mangrovi]
MAVETWERSGAELAEHIRARRDKHLVVISQRTDSDLLHLDAEYVGAELEGLADVVVVKQGPITYGLSESVPEDWRVYGDSARAYPAELSAGIGRPSIFVKAFRTAERRSKADELIDLVNGFPVPPAALRHCSVQRQTPAQPAIRTGTITGFLGGGERAIVSFPFGVTGAIRQEDLVPNVRLDWLLAAGQEVSGRLDPESKVLHLEAAVHIPRLGQAYQWNSLVLCLVEEATPEAAKLAVLPGQTITVPLADISSNPLDQADDLVTPGQIVVARLRQQCGRPKLSLIDVDDDEDPVRAPVLIAGGTPWLELGRDLLPPTTAELDQRAEAAKASAAEEAAQPLPAGDAQPVAGPALKQVQLQLATLQAQMRRLRDDAEKHGSAVLEMAGLLAQVDQLERELDKQSEELDKLRTETRQKTAELMASRSRAQKAERKLRRVQDRSGHFASQEEQFRHELYLAWVERVSAAEKSALWLQDFAVGPKLLTSFYVHSEEHRRKALKALVDLLVGRAAKVQGRQLHQLRIGEGGEDAPIVRAEDGARCWRMSVESNAPAARRIHFWCIPGGGIELHELVPHEVTTV